MDATTILLVIAGFVFFLIVIGWIISASQRFGVRPQPYDTVQSSWEEHKRLRDQAINGVFWRFVARIEFVLLMGAATYVSISLQADWYYPTSSALLCILGVLFLFS